MADYVYRRLVRRHWYRRYTVRRRVLFAFAGLVLIIAAIILVDSLRSDKPQPKTSNIQSITVGDQINTFKSPYFSFQDTGKWALNKKDSTAQKFVYYKYRGVQPLYQLIVYVNQTPIPLDLATSRVLPIRIVNTNSFDVTSVYGPCVNVYGSGELHQVKVVTIQGAQMLCDPDTPQYSIVLSEVGGDWQLDMKRRSGSDIKVVITFHDFTLNPEPDTLLQIANSFQTL